MCQLQSRLCEIRNAYETDLFWMCSENALSSVSFPPSAHHANGRSTPGPGVALNRGRHDNRTEGKAEMKCRGENEGRRKGKEGHRRPLRCDPVAVGGCT